MPPENTQIAPDTTQQAPTQNPSTAMLAQPGLPGASASAALGAATSPSATMQAPQQPSTSAAPQAQSAPAVQAPSPQQQAQTANIGKHALLGRLASYLLGSEKHYAPNPETGQIDEASVQRKPGDLFRSIVSGAIMGMAAGSQSHDFAGGFGQGGAAAIQQNQAQDQQRYARAQQAQESQQKKAAFDEEKRSHDAQIAQMTANGLRDDANFNLMSQKYLDDRNDREAAFQLQLDQAGGAKMQIQSGGQDINGAYAGNGKDLQRIAGNNLDDVRAPDGYHTLHVMRVDTTGLTKKNGQWLDENGNPVNLEDHTTHTLYQLPDNAWNKHADGVNTGDDLNKIVGFKIVDPNAKINMTVGDVMSARTKGQEAALQTAQINLDVYKARLDAANAKRQIALAGKQIAADTYKQFLTTYDTVKATVTALQDQIKNRQVANPDADIADLQKELNDTTDDLSAIRQRLFPNTATPGAATNPGAGNKALPKPPKTGAVITPDVAKQYLSANGNDPAKARQAATNDGWAVR